MVGVGESAGATTKRYEVRLFALLRVDTFIGKTALGSRNKCDKEALARECATPWPVGPTHKDTKFVDDAGTTAAALALVVSCGTCADDILLLFLYCFFV